MPQGSMSVSKTQQEVYTRPHNGYPIHRNSDKHSRLSHIDSEELY